VAGPDKKRDVVNPWAWVDYLEVLTDGVTEYHWGGSTGIRDMKAAKKKTIVVLKEEHAERDVHPLERLDLLIQAGVFLRSTDVADPVNGTEGSI
jgi:hypothetical protein